MWHLLMCIHSLLVNAHHDEDIEHNLDDYPPRRMLHTVEMM